MSVPVEIVGRLTNSSANAPDTGDRLAEHILPDATEANLSGWRLWEAGTGQEAEHLNLAVILRSSITRHDPETRPTKQIGGNFGGNFR